MNRQNLSNQAEPPLYEAFEALRDQNEFVKVVNVGYFVEWGCGADLSADTIEARWEAVGNVARQRSA